MNNFLTIIASKNLASIIVIVMILASTACKKVDSFDEEAWKDNSDIDDKGNPRSAMAKDLIDNHLKINMTRSEIIAILGLPYKESMENRLPKGLKIPDSLDINNTKLENKDHIINSVNRFYKLHAQKDTLMLYNIGWSTIDPRFLVVELNGRGKAKSFEIE